jgi:hypothetical protein
MNESGTWVYNNDVKYQLGEVPCDSCGKMVAVLLPFVGCVYCGDCISLTNNFYTSGTSNEGE